VPIKVLALDLWKEGLVSRVSGFMKTPKSKALDGVLNSFP
jgi:hypothetical protein